jgi:hypothetical protein
MLQVASVLSVCCICFTHMFHLYVPNVHLFSDIRCIQVFHILEVCSESHGTRSGCWGMGRGEAGARAGASGRGVWRTWGPADGGVLVLIPAPGPARAERGGSVVGKEPWAQRQGQGVRVEALRGGWGRAVRASGRPCASHVRNKSQKVKIYFTNW